jgi:phosphonatase-like hydrolase
MDRARGIAEVAMGIELAVFDMAGTTVNDEDGVNRCVRAALAAAGISASAGAVNAVMGIPKPEALAILIEQSGRGNELAGRLGAIHRDFVARSIDFYTHDPSVHEVAGARAVFDTLRQAGIRVALNTGFDRAITRVILDRLGWSGGGAIDASICSDEVARGRPHPDMIIKLMEKFGVTDPQRVAKIGDTPADLEEGSRAGCGLIVGVTQGTHTREQLQTHPHTHLIATVAEFPALLAARAR